MYLSLLKILFHGHLPILLNHVIQGHVQGLGSKAHI